MSFRKKTVKFGQTYGTPTTPTTPTPKAPSPKAPKIIRTVTAPTVTTAPKAVTKPTTQRGAIPTTPAGIIAQEQFKTQVQSITEPIRNQLTSLQIQLSQVKDVKYLQPILDKIEQKEKELIEAPLAANVQQILGALESGDLVYPDWFENNIGWVKTGHITSKEFLDSYYHLSNQGIIHSPIAEPEIIEEIIEEPIIELPELLPEVSAEPDTTITDNMVTQQLINFNIVNGRAVGSIKFVATNNFNPFYYGQNIVNIIQFKDPNGANILTYVKENRLNFTETERDEVLTYDEDMKGNTRATVESFVWSSSAITPTPFSKMYSIEISEAEPPKPITSGFMGAGIAGAIAGLVLIGFIADHKRGK